MNRNLDDFSRDCVANTQQGHAFWVDATNMEIERIKKFENLKLLQGR